MIIVVGGVKGGSGKTTIATNLTYLRSESGRKVLLVDADEQKSASIFANQRDVLGIETKWTTIQLAGKTVYTQLERLRSDYDDIIVDAGGRDTSSQRSALLVADLYLIPFNPASYDIWTIADVKTIITDMRTANKNLRAIAFINRADPRGKDNQEAISILQECEEFECLNFTLGNRKSFRSSASDGLSVAEMTIRDSKAIQEMRDLYEHIYTKCTF